MKLLKLLFYNILILIGTLSLLLILYINFENSIYIETHYDPKVLVLSGSILLSSILITSFGLAKLLGETIYHSIMRLGLGLMMSIFSINIISLYQMSIKILGYNDIIYNGKFFTIYYKYSKVELLKYVNKYYNDISGTNKVLSLQEQAKILGDAKTITEVQAQVEKYYNIEVNSWWTKLSTIMETGMNWCLEHPGTTTAIIAGITTIIVYPVYKFIMAQYTLAINIRELNSTVNEMDKMSSELSSKIDKISSELSSEMNKIRGLSSVFELNKATELYLAKTLNALIITTTNMGKILNHMLQLMDVGTEGLNFDDESLVSYNAEIVKALANFKKIQIPESIEITRISDVD